MTVEEVLPKEIANTSCPRRGKWTVEEERYTEKIIFDFENGTLDVPEGTTLRTYLSKILNCDPMRITKKYTGNCSIGKRTFTPLSRTAENALFIEVSQQDLRELRRVWINKLLLMEQWNNRKKNGSEGGGEGDENGTGATSEPDEAHSKGGDGDQVLDGKGTSVGNNRDGTASQGDSGALSGHMNEVMSRESFHEERLRSILSPYLTTVPELDYIIKWLKTLYYVLVDKSLTMADIEHSLYVGSISMPALLAIYQSSCINDHARLRQVHEAIGTYLRHCGLHVTPQVLPQSKKDSNGGDARKEQNFRNGSSTVDSEHETAALQLHGLRNSPHSKNKSSVKEEGTALVASGVHKNMLTKSDAAAVASGSPKLKSQLKQESDRRDSKDVYLEELERNRMMYGGGGYPGGAAAAAAAAVAAGGVNMYGNPFLPGVNAMDPFNPYQSMTNVDARLLSSMQRGGDVAAAYMANRRGMGAGNGLGMAGYGANGALGHMMDPFNPQQSVIPPHLQPRKGNSNKNKLHNDDRIGGDDGWEDNARDRKRPKFDAYSDPYYQSLMQQQNQGQREFEAYQRERAAAAAAAGYMYGDGAGRLAMPQDSSGYDRFGAAGFGPLHVPPLGGMPGAGMHGFTQAGMMFMKQPPGMYPGMSGAVGAIGVAAAKSLASGRMSEQSVLASHNSHTCDASINSRSSRRSRRSRSGQKKKANGMGNAVGDVEGKESKDGAIKTSASSSSVNDLVAAAVAVGGGMAGTESDRAGDATTAMDVTGANSSAAPAAERESLDKSITLKDGTTKTESQPSLKNKEEKNTEFDPLMLFAAYEARNKNTSSGNSDLLSKSSVEKYDADHVTVDGKYLHAVEEETSIASSKAVRAPAESPNCNSTLGPESAASGETSDPRMRIGGHKDESSSYGTHSSADSFDERTALTAGSSTAGHLEKMRLSEDRLSAAGVTAAAAMKPDISMTVHNADRLSSTVAPEVAQALLGLVRK